MMMTMMTVTRRNFAFDQSAPSRKGESDLRKQHVTGLVIVVAAMLLCGRLKLRKLWAGAGDVRYNDARACGVGKIERDGLGLTAKVQIIDSMVGISERSTNTARRRIVRVSR